MRMSILSERQSRPGQMLRLGGKIRPGIKLLTSAAKANPKAKQLYDAGVIARTKFSEIEKRIEAETGIRNSLYPRNTSYFNVAASDFAMPEIAASIIAQYGEIRAGDPEKRLYRFPIVFHSDDIFEVYPNQLKRYGGEPGYESHYGVNGVRYCQYLPPVTKEMLAEQRAKRIKRQPRRDKVTRGECKPERCQEYLEGQCRFRGRLHFYIPGIPTTGVLAMETTSEYAAEAIWSYLDEIVHSFGGIPRFNPNKPGVPIFWITKRQEERTYFDEKGEKKKGLQWVPVIESEIDIGRMLSIGFTPTAQPQQTPVAWLKAPVGMPTANVLPQTESAANDKKLQDPQQEATGNRSCDSAIDPAGVQDQESSQQQDLGLQYQILIDEIGAPEDRVEAYLDLKIGKDWTTKCQLDPTILKKCVDQLSSLQALGNDCAAYLIEISVQASEIGVSHEEFRTFAQMKYGTGFSRNPKLLEVISSDLAALAENGVETARAFIKAQIKN